MKRYFIDTNVIVHFFIRDNETQYQQVRQLFDQASEGKCFLFTSLVSFFEVKWVLSSVYSFTKKEIIEKLELLLLFDSLEIGEREDLYQALKIYKETNIELEDCYNIVFSQAQSSEKTEIFTFDRRMQKQAAKWIEGRLLEMTSKLSALAKSRVPPESRGQKY